MSKYATLSQSAFDAKALMAIENSPLRKEVSLKDIEIIRAGTLKYGDRNIKMEEAAFKGICKIIGLPIGFDKTFTQAFGDKARQALTHRLKIAVQAKGTTSLSLILNPVTKKIVSVQADKKDLISNKLFISTASNYIDKYNLQVNDFSVGTNGAVVINTSSPQNEWAIKGLIGEEHYGGMAFTNSPDFGFSASPYIQRLVCANGMIGTAFEETMRLGQMSVSTMDLFQVRMEEMAARGFKPRGFDAACEKAMNTNASLFEMEKIHTMLQRFSDADHDELETWVPLHNTRSAFNAAKLDPLFLNDDQKKNAKTGTSVYELIQGITHFASHDNGFTVNDYDRRVLQVNAANLLTKKSFDMANQVLSPFN